MRKILNRSLDKLKKLILEMTDLVMTSVNKTTEIIIEPDEKKISEVLELEDTIDEYEKKIEECALDILISLQVVASDFRTVTAATKIAGNLERIGDGCEDIANLINETKYSDAQALKKMAEDLKSMTDSLSDLIFSESVEDIVKFIKSDSIIDDDFSEVKKVLALRLLDTKNNDKVLDELMIAKYMEKIADHSVNIAEWILYEITGEHKWI